MLLNVQSIGRRNSRSISSRRGSGSSLLGSSLFYDQSSTPTYHTFHHQNYGKRQLDHQLEHGRSTDQGDGLNKRAIQGSSNHLPPISSNRSTIINGPVDVDAGRVLVGIGRAVLARLIFIVHSVVTIWTTVNVQGSESVWIFAFIALLIIFEGSYTIIMRAGDERKWFCASVLLYVLATAPPIWLLEMKLCEWRLERLNGKQSIIPIANEEDELRLQLLEQLMLVVLIIGRWLLPKGDISREQLSQILLAYLAISSDIVEFFDVFKEREVFMRQHVQIMVLIAWTLSLLQFPFVLTVSRARKMRVAITETDDGLILPEKPHMSSVCNDVDIWAILLANSLQDIPFLLVRLYLMFERGLITYTMLFFTCKNALIIALQTYRAFVLINDRYVHPHKVEKAKARRQHRKQTSPKKRRTRREFQRSEEMEHLCSMQEPEEERSPKREGRLIEERSRRRGHETGETPSKSSRTRRSEIVDEERIETRRRSGSRKKNNEKERRTRSGSRISPPQNGKGERSKSVKRSSSAVDRSHRVR